MTRGSDLARIEEALRAAAAAVRPWTPGDVEYVDKDGAGDPLTKADLAADRVLREVLLTEGSEGWLSEETADDRSRLGCGRVWIVDPIDGTREFVAGIPEWCISIGLVEEGIPIAGGVFAPSTDELILGSIETGVTLNGAPVRPDWGEGLGGRVLASRSEMKRGEWDRFADAPFEVVPCGSVAYKLARVAAGLDEMTFTLVPKNEWDVAAGAALVTAAGGVVSLATGEARRFNQPDPLLPNFLAGSTGAVAELRDHWL